MKNKIITLIVVLMVGALVSYCYNNFITRENIIGQYINQNYDQSVLADVPHVSDTLALFNDGHFESGFWGKGLYKITYTLGGTEIELIYKNKFGEGGFESSITRINWGTPKIIIDRDLDYYYEKL